MEAACAEGEKALSLVTKLRSVRGSEQLAGFVRDLEPYRSHPVVRDFTERADEALAAPTDAAPAPLHHRCVSEHDVLDGIVIGLT